MIEPRTLAQMIAASRLEATKAAIVAEMKRLLGGVTVVAHPGKLDINDVVARAVVQAPGVAIGWTRVRADRQAGGHYTAPVEWAAYIVVEDRADLATKMATSRETIGHAIGSTILDILADPDVASWGRPGLGLPFGDPPPAFVPLVTMKSMEGGAAVYGVTWTQAAWDEGSPFMDDETPVLIDADGSIEIDEDDAEGLPPEIRALIAGHEA